MRLLDEPRGVSFELPTSHIAKEPPEARGLKRDEVRLLVAREEGNQHARFNQLGEFLEPGDVVVVNTSSTLPAAVDGVRNGQPVTAHFSTPLEDGSWVVELRTAGGELPLFDASPGDRVYLKDRGSLLLTGSYAADRRNRLSIAVPDLDRPVGELLSEVGRPISYGNLTTRWPLGMYQTVFARHAGSAEMPSAGRPFTDALVTRLITSGISLAPITLHAGVSSQEAGELPLPERLTVPPATARLVNHTRRNSGRVIAIGTTVTRALESAADEDGRVSAAKGWTELVLGPGRPARVVDGLVTGWHPPEASHLMLLEAVAGRRMVQKAYDDASESGYLWHEFGDSCLFLPPPRHELVGNLHKT